MIRRVGEGRMCNDPETAGMTEPDPITRWQRARALFERCVELDSAARAAVLDAACADDPDLRREVESLLAADLAAEHEPTVPGLGASADLVDALLADSDDVDERRWLGVRIGAFKIERVLGRGGMGAVFLANRVDGEYAQQVAIKLIRQGYGASSLHARLRSERQILASLAHPRIARLLDGGVAVDGTPYIVMEFVDGANLLEYCQREHLGTPARLALFLSLLDAVEYAHQRLVVHRDIKPSNILVDREGRAKLLDFGVAKLLVSDATSTASVGAAPFTPAYAAPEQIRGETVTTAIDIYALGLVLYEVLTGARPYRVDESSPRAYEIAVLEQTPTRPSDAVRADRDIDVASVRNALRGDLDAIVLKALRKEPTQRYASVAEFAADIRSHLEQRPVAARQGNFRYIAGRFLRRHAFAMTLGTLALTGVIAAAVVAEVQRRDAVAARLRAESEATRANEVTDFMVNVFGNAEPDPITGAEVTAIGLLTAARDQIRNEVVEPATRAALLLAIARAIFTVHGGHDFSGITEEAVRLRRELGNALELSMALRTHVNALIRLDHTAAAHAALDEAEQALLGLGSEADRERARIKVQRATLLMNDAHFDQSATVFAEALAGMRALGVSETEGAMIDLRNRLGYVLVQTQEPERGRVLLRALVDDLQKQDPSPLDTIAAIQNNLGFSWAAQDDLPLAEAAFRAALTARLQQPKLDVVSVQHNRANLARTLGELGRYEEAIHEAKTGHDAVVAANDARVSPRILGYVRRLLAELEWRRGHWQDALAWVDRGIAFAQTDQPSSLGRLRTLRFFRAAILIDLNRFPEADVEMAAARALIDPASPPSDAVIIDTESVRLALLRGTMPDCAGLERHDANYRGQRSSADYYILAYTEFCRAVTQPEDTGPRVQLERWIDWLDQRMPDDDQRVVHLRALSARYFPLMRAASKATNAQG